MKMREIREVVNRYLILAAFVVGALVAAGYVVVEIQLYREKIRTDKNNNELLHVLPVGNF